MEHTRHHEASAIALVKQAWQGYDEESGAAGFMSCAIYDTAWVSMVSKQEVATEQKQWLFPESFDHLLRTQSDDGSWGAASHDDDDDNNNNNNNASSQIDGILNTAASLLSLHKHRSEPLNIPTGALDGIDRRIRRATESLASQLRRWDVTATVHVGFEMIVPALLDMLRTEDPSLVFDFGGEAALSRIHASKMSRFAPEALYGRKPSTALHSLEAFAGRVDFDRLGYHKVGGSMMASPSSTAAYLMRVSRWDDEAEDYLRRVVRAGVGCGGGAVPSAFPSMFFEYTWVLSTLLRAGYSVEDIQCPELDAMTKLLREAFDQGQGIIGFAPGLPPDVDDTAKCIICLNKLGRTVSPAAMVAAFEADTHFRTYASERNPSFTANCNALSTLLQQPEPSLYAAQILKVVAFLCDCWWKSEGGIRDKWNLSPLYPSLLVVQAFVDLLVQVGQGKLEPLSQDLQSRVHITLFQACLRALLRHPDATSTEQVAYQILILCEAKRLPLFQPLSPTIDACIHNQVGLLSKTTTDSELEAEANRIWIEKVSFGSQVVTQSYKLAALRASSHPATVLDESSQQHDGFRSLAGDRKYVELLKQTPLFASTPEWQIQASMLEASLFRPLLRRRRLEVFPRLGMEKDKYFDLIPLTWTSCNNRRGTFASTSFLYEMMVISFLDFQADEFMEAVAGPSFGSNTDSLRRLIDDIFIYVSDGELGEIPDHRVNLSSATNGKSTNGVNGGSHVATNGSAEKTVNNPSTPEDNNTIKQNQVRKTLTKFIFHICHHPSVQSASPWDRQSTLRELRIYLHAHATQFEDNNARLQCTKHHQTSSLEKAGFFRWVHTTSADHTAAPYSFAFAGCLLSNAAGGAETFPSARSKYLAAAACGHLATMCRMYNDYGSVARDRAEGNLNSVDFGELAGAEGEEARKKTLLELAQYERGWLEDAMSCLREEARRLGREWERQMEVWDMFCDVTDLYGQIYLVKDIASRMINGKVNGNGTSKQLS